MTKKHIGIIGILGITFLIGWYGGSNRNALAESSARRTTSITNDDFSLYLKALEILDSKHTDAQGVSSKERVWASIEGLTKSYGDPYTTFFNPEANKAFEESINGEFSGVGMEVDIKEGYLTVIAPLKDSPAEQAGLLPKDTIIEIDGVSTLDMTLEEAVQNIRGPKGESVELTIVREGVENVLVFTVVRDIIELISVDTTFFEKDNIFKIDLYTFSDDLEESFSAAMNEFIESGSNKLILDLRSNPGGFLSSSIDIASWFIPEGDVVVVEKFAEQSGKKNIIYRSSGSIEKLPQDLQMVVLVDGGSASASEIVAGALQEYKIAELVGTKTFGKGSVQEYISLDAESAIKVTVAKWLTPKGASIEDDGLTPDHLVEYDAESEGDTQLDFAISLLKD